MATVEARFADINSPSATCPIRVWHCVPLIIIQDLCSCGLGQRQNGLTISSFVVFALYERKNDKHMIGTYHNHSTF